MVKEQNFCMYSGDTIEIIFDVTMPDPADTLAGADIRWVLAKGEKILIQKSIGEGISIIDDTSFRVLLEHDDTKDLYGEGYRHEAEVKKANIISTVAVGRVEIKYTYIKRMEPV